MNTTARRPLLSTVVAAAAAIALTRPGSARNLVEELLGSLPGVATDARGFGSTPLSFPNDPAIVGLRLTSQYVVFDPAGSPFGFSTLSDGILIQVGA